MGPSDASAFSVHDPSLSTEMGGVSRKHHLRKQVQHCLISSQNMDSSVCIDRLELFRVLGNVFLFPFTCYLEEFISCFSIVCKVAYKSVNGSTNLKIADVFSTTPAPTESEVCCILFISLKFYARTLTLKKHVPTYT